MTYINIDVDVDDVVEQLSSREKQKLVDALYDDGYYQTELEKERKEYDKFSWSSESRLEEVYEMFNPKSNPDE